MKRVMILGAPGSGKSTVARKLGDLTDLPVFHMDKIHYKPGWVDRTKAEKDELTREVHAKEQWIFEGGHSSTYQERFERADTVIWLDFPVGLRIYRVLKRSLQYYGQTRPDLPDGCPERFDWNTVDFLKFIWRTRRTTRVKVMNLIQGAPADKAILQFREQSEVDEYLSLQAQYSASTNVGVR